MKIGAAGLKIIRSYESLRLHAYAATEVERAKGIWTIGYGHTKDVKEGDTCTIEQAEQWLREDCAEAETAVNLVGVPLTQNQFDALVSFVFNVGAGAFKISTMRRKLAAKDYTGAADEFPKWTKQAGKVLGGLVKRRQKERELFLSMGVFV